MKLTVLPWLIWAFIAATVVWATKAHSDPVMQAVDGEVRVVLFTEKCELTSLIQNLPYKAEWHEKGKVFQGCWGARPSYGFVLTYFADLTVGVIPIQALTKVRGA